FGQSFWPGLTNWLPFYWAGFSQTTRYTYWVPKLSDLDALWADFLENARNYVRKAEKRLSVDVSGDVDLLCDMYERTFSQQGQPTPYPRSTLFSIANCAIQHGHGRIACAVDAQKNVHAANLIVFDSRATHYLVAGSDNRFRTSGAASLL